MTEPGGSRQSQPRPPGQPGPPSPERIAEKHHQALYSDYFTLLEVDRDADSPAIHRASAALLDEFSPSRAEDLSKDDQTRMRLISLVLRDALEVLGDPRLRAMYRRRLPG